MAVEGHLEIREVGVDVSSLAEVAGAKVGTVQIEGVVRRSRPEAEAVEIGPGVALHRPNVVAGVPSFSFELAELEKSVLAWVVEAVAFQVEEVDERPST